MYVCDNIEKPERKKIKKKRIKKNFLFLFPKSNIPCVGYQVTYETVHTQEFCVKSLNFSCILKFIIFRRKKNTYLKKKN